MVTGGETVTQRERIARHLEDFGSITSYEAFRDYGVTRLSAVIFDLKKKGYPIITEKEKTRNRYDEPVIYGRYKLCEV